MSEKIELIYLTMLKSSNNTLTLGKYKHPLKGLYFDMIVDNDSGFKWVQFELLPVKMAQRYEKEEACNKA